MDLKVELPRTVAVELAEVQQEDPELLGRMLMYTMARRRIFDRLVAARFSPADAIPTSA